MATLIDSYSESHYVFSTQLDQNSRGQSFTNTNEITLDSCKFYIKRDTGVYQSYVKAKIYSHTGTYGTSSLPNTLLATSDTVNVLDLPTSLELYTFTFSGANRITLNASTYYVLVLEHTKGYLSTTVSIGLDIPSPSHSGNYSSNDTGSWAANSIIDTCFYIYGESSSTSIKLVNGLAKASVKSKEGLAIASVKNINGLV